MMRVYITRRESILNGQRSVYYLLLRQKGTADGKPFYLCAHCACATIFRDAKWFIKVSVLGILSEFGKISIIIILR